MNNIDESMIDDITTIIDQAPNVLRSDKNKMITWLEKQIPKSQGKVLEDSYITPNEEFFQFIYDRLRYVHKENPNTDYMLSLKERISNMYYLEGNEWEAEKRELRKLEKQEEQNPKWNNDDEDYNYIRYLCILVDNIASYEYGKKVKCWLKSLKQRLEGEIMSKDNNKITWFVDTGKMTKEDYMRLPKERLAEMLMARDNQPTISYIPFQSPRLQCYEPGGICTNPLRDCINCPRVFGDQNYTITTSQTIVKEE